MPDLAFTGTLLEDDNIDVEPVTAAAKATGAAVQVVGGVTRWFRRRREVSRFAGQCLRALGVEATDRYSYRPGLQHPSIAVGSAHPDDRLAFCTMVGEGASLVSAGRWEAVDSLPPSELSDGHILIGSPEAEYLTQLAFGYSRLADNRLAYVGNTIELPYRWLEDRDAVHALSGKYSAGSEYVSQRPNWPVVDNSGLRERLLFPEVDRDGMLLTDYLIITKVPNFLTVDGLQLGRSIISIAGTHGVGTKSIAKLVTSSADLATIAIELNGNDSAFQVLIRASQIQHRPRYGSTANKIEVLHVTRLADNFAKWDRACGVVTKSIQDWRQMHANDKMEQ